MRGYKSSRDTFALVLFNTTLWYFRGGDLMSHWVHIGRLLYTAFIYPVDPPLENLLLKPEDYKISARQEKQAKVWAHNLVNTCWGIQIITLLFKL